MHDGKISRAGNVWPDRILVIMIMFRYTVGFGLVEMATRSESLRYVVTCARIQSLDHFRFLLDLSTRQCLPLDR